MKLSVIIVSYNVKFFLEQCLRSCIKATQNLDAEIIVVDNNSVDESAQMVQEKFPNINLIRNKENVGFSKANNQAIKQVKGEFILLLNPDTLVEEEAFEKSLAFIEKQITTSRNRVFEVLLVRLLYSELPVNQASFPPA